MLNGLRVLVVEDNPAVATDISDLIERAEGEVLGPVGSLREARQMVKSEQAIDAAVLDVSLSDGDITPVLETLRARHVGIVVYTGGSGLPPGVGERHPDLVILRKPVQPGRIVGEIQRACRGAGAGH
jgi:CheY-like chemotaxis protein